MRILYHRVVIYVYGWESTFVIVKFCRTLCSKGLPLGRTDSRQLLVTTRRF